MNKLINYFKRRLFSFKYNWDYLQVLNSPFKGLKLKWYFGEIQHGVPYFLPRRWVKMTQADCEEALERDRKTCLPKYMESRTWEYYKNCTKPVMIKYFGYNSCTLGWKTKWDTYRFEYSPCYSLVIFGKQLCVHVVPNTKDVSPSIYWEAWLTYRDMTDKAKPAKERLKELKKHYSGIRTVYKNGIISNEEDYYPLILKEKYI